MFSSLRYIPETTGECSFYGKAGLNCPFLLRDENLSVQARPHQGRQNQKSPKLKGMPNSCFPPPPPEKSLAGKV